jgi:hypothetical protein
MERMVAERAMPPVPRNLSTYFLAVGGNRPFARRYIAAAP